MADSEVPDYVKRPAHLRVIDVSEYDKEDPNQKLPSADTNPLVDILDLDKGGTFQLKRDDVRKSPLYVDNAADKMQAQPVSLVTLEVETMEFSSNKGGKFEVDMSDIRYTPALPSYAFQKKNGFYWPLFYRTGEVLFDAYNTPQIVKVCQWVLNKSRTARKHT